MAGLAEFWLCLLLAWSILWNNSREAFEMRNLKIHVTLVHYFAIRHDNPSSISTIVCFVYQDNKRFYKLHISISVSLFSVLCCPYFQPMSIFRFQQEFGRYSVNAYCGVLSLTLELDAHLVNWFTLFLWSQLVIIIPLSTLWLWLLADIIF